MKAIPLIKRVLKTDLLEPALVTVPVRGATQLELAREEQAVGSPFSSQLRALLAEWNGLDLEVVRVYGCVEAPPLRRISDEQAWVRGSDWWERGLVVFGSSPAGFAYAQSADGAIVQVDYKSWTEKKRLAVDLESFLVDYVFGSEAKAFGGEEWVGELRKHGLLEPET